MTLPYPISFVEGLLSGREEIVRPVRLLKSAVPGPSLRRTLPTTSICAPRISGRRLRREGRGFLDRLSGFIASRCPGVTRRGGAARPFGRGRNRRVQGRDQLLDGRDDLETARRR